MKLFKKILIANRGEIAVRVIRAAQKLGIESVAIYSEADSESLHVKMADEAYALGSNELADTYLNIEKIVSIALASGSEAIHPGYGFLAENSAFVRACNKAKVVFIGPNARAMKLMGNKIESREALKKAGIPMTAGITGDYKTLISRAKEIPLPILIKAAAGGGGKGMRIVHDAASLPEILESTSREAKSYFGDGTVYIEKYIEEPRHIEIQVLGDNYGNVIHLFERECSIQRRYQKIIEESPSPTLTARIRREMGETAVRIAREIGYNNAGTVEFLVDKELNYYFLEMNTRVQVEHPVTEMVTGIDIVWQQILIAAGEKLEISQEDIHQEGHAIECRIYAEDPENNFLPSPGRMSLYVEPSGNDTRLDTGLEKATTIHSFYDPLISKLIVWGENREIAREKMISALDHYVVHGIKTNISYLRKLLQHKAYIDNGITTKYCDEHTEELVEEIRREKGTIPAHLPVIAYYLHEFSKGRFSDKGAGSNAWKETGFWRDVMELSGKMDGTPFNFEIGKILGNSYRFIFFDQPYDVMVIRSDGGALVMLLNGMLYHLYISTGPDGMGYVSYKGFIFKIMRNDILLENEMILGSFGGDGSKTDGKIVSPMPGKVIKVNVKEGEEVKKGSTLVIVEAMKMENYITAPFDGTVESINIKKGDMVTSNMRLIVLKEMDKNILKTT